MRRIFAFLVVSSFFISCLKDKTIPSDGCGTIISYKTEIRPIIEASCKTGLGPGTGCHDAWIDDYDPIKNQIAAGKWIDEIFVKKRMPFMPNDFGIDSLSDDNLKTIKCWIDQGYPEN